jgi:hypothetical protein
MVTTQNPFEFIKSLQNFEFEKVSKETIDDLQDIVSSNPEFTIENLSSRIGCLPVMFFTFVQAAIEIHKVLN